MRAVHQLRAEFAVLCEKLSAHRSLHSAPQHDGSAHVEVSNDRYHYVVTERGTELERRTTTEAEELLYWRTSDVVFELATAFELKHRVKGQSFRRLLFQKEVELLECINPQWAKREQAEIEAIPEKQPYDDKVEG
jgi:hypothetical protein